MLRAGSEDPAEILAAEIVEAFRETGLRPARGEWLADDYGNATSADEATCACAGGALAKLKGVSPFPGSIPLVRNHSACLARGWDDIGTDEECQAEQCDAGLGCHVYQAGVLAAHAMETP